MATPFKHEETEECLDDTERFYLNRYPEEVEAEAREQGETKDKMIVAKDDEESLPSVFKESRMNSKDLEAPYLDNPFAEAENTATSPNTVKATANANVEKTCQQCGFPHLGASITCPKYASERDLRLMLDDIRKNPEITSYRACLLWNLHECLEQKHANKAGKDSKDSKRE